MHLEGKSLLECQLKRRMTLQTLQKEQKIQFIEEVKYSVTEN